MDFIKSIGLVGGAALATTGPVGLAAAAAINAWLGDDEEPINETSTTEEVISKFEALSPSVQELVAKDYYLHLTAVVENNSKVAIAREEEITKQLKIMEESDKNIMVRPTIVQNMAWLVIAMISVITIIHCTDVLLNGTDWNVTLLTFLMALPIWVIKAYFNKRSEDKAIKAQVLNNDAVSLPNSIGTRLVDKLLK